MIEMEYALPREALGELKTMVDRSDLRVSFPVEVRTAPADDITLSPGSGRESAYIAVHVYRGTSHQEYFKAPATPRTSQTPTRASPSSPHCATASTPNGASPTTTCAGFWATESAHPLAPIQLYLTSEPPPRCARPRPPQEGAPPRNSATGRPVT